MINQDTWEFIQKNLKEDVRQLALKKVSNEQIDVKTALRQIEGYQIALKKLPSWARHEHLLYPPKISMEQCSSEATALYKQELVKRLLPHAEERHQMTDLTGGFGIDFSFLASLFQKANYVEQQEILCTIASYNFQIMELQQANVIHGDALEELGKIEKQDLIFIDPARRDGQGRKTVALADCTPDLEAIQKELLQKSSFCIAKLSPMLDIHQAIKQLNHIQEVHIISVDNECKELLLIMNEQYMDQPVIFCSNIQKGICQTFSYRIEEEEEATPCYTSSIGGFLYEPNASLMKAGGYKILCSRLPVQKLHPNSHLYISQEWIDGFPGRGFRIDECYSFNKKDLKSIAQNTPQANMTIRNFPSRVEELRKKLKIKEGGSVYLFATTKADDTHCIIKCRRPEDVHA